MVNVGIIGATGHTGEALIGVLLTHPDARISKLYNTSEKPQKISDVFPKFKNRIDLTCHKPDINEIRDSCDVVFCALPHTVSMQFVPQILKAGPRVIDLSADYRLNSASSYESAYNTSHADAARLKSVVYGLPEIYRNKIKTARLVANPGCYPTASILAAAPLVALGLADPASVIIDAKSGVTGAGKKVTEGLLFGEVNEDFKAYKVNSHQHAPEINQELSKLAGTAMKIVFVPYLLPLNWGILATAYARPFKKKKIADEELVKLFRKFYGNEPFIRVREPGVFPRLKDVQGTNFCDIGIKAGDDCFIVIAAIDNLMKGAAGQAVHNMNIMFNFPEKAGLA